MTPAPMATGTQMSSTEPAPPFPTIKSKNSLVAKYVTEELWNRLGGHQTATSGFTLTKAIACAVRFDNQHCGIYAGDWDSYNDFREIFDPIIQEYHGIKEDAIHKSDMDVTQIKGNINEDSPVRSVRIRVGRSIDGFGLSPGITKDQRIGVENLMKSAFQKLSGDLSGTYYPLTGMDEKVQKQLVDDHFLFMSGDQNLKAAGMERDWPEGRGIYHNKEKTFLVWVNEEDQLRIISMEMGGDVRGVFERLARGINAVGESVKAESGKDFAYDEKYGFIHSCPTNLGTGMRASVHVDLPGWTKEGLDVLKKRCEELKVQPRGTRGESGGQTGCTYDISNKHRLGYSEVELIQCMIDGVNTLCKEDIELQKKHDMYPAMPEIASTHSLVAKHVTPEAWKKLAMLKTKTSGFSLYKGIACAVLFNNQHCGIYAGDWDSYKDFKDVFDPIIQEYHGISPDATHTSDMDVSKVNGNIDSTAPVHSVRIRVGRSIDGFGLSPGITKDQRLGVENLMKSAFKELPGDLSGTYYPLTGMDEKIRQQLVDDHFLFMSGDPNLKVAGMERNWPEGRGIFHNKEKTFLVWVNEEDQLRIISMEMGGDVRGVFERLVRGIGAVQTSVKKESGKNFMLDPKYGYIHSCPTNLGTGMRASVHIDLPGWTKEGMDALKKRCEELKVQPRGTRGESGGQTGCTFDISNKHRLGYSEVELVQCMIDGVNTLYQEDITMQRKHEIFPVMPEVKSANSLVAKHLTPELWTKLHELKTSNCNFTLRQAIATSLLFSNQHCGIYAGDWDSYKLFSELFDPIIQEYHGLAPDTVHTSDMDSSKLQGNIDPDIPVQSVRIRVGRNMTGFGLSPGITELQRLSVEQVMKVVFERLRGDFNGSYYPLVGMTEEKRQQLVDDHFLFMSGDPNLKVAGMERHWPSGRGIFYNESKTFLVWVNEEDQLRIISMDMGGDIKTVFERLAIGIKNVGDGLKKEYEKEFAFDPKYGYIHSCPTNLGTGMRASVHVDLPGWSKEGMEALLKRCEELKVQPRGTRGESGGQTGWTFDISNKHRLGYTEVQLVQCMIDGVNTLYKEDIELQKTHGIFPVMPELRAKTSLVSKHLTPELWKKYSQKKTKTVSFSLRQAITCSLMFEDQKIGIYAGDADCYKDYKEVFDSIIKDYHGINLFAAHCSCFDISKLKGNIDPCAPVFSVRIRFSRNVDGFGFSPGITKQQRLQVETLAKNSFTKLPGELSGTYYPLLGMADDTREQLFKDGFLFKCGDRDLKAAGSERDWPEGRGIFHNSTKTFLVWVNEEDQLKIISMQQGGNIRAAFERIIQGVWSIRDSIKGESTKNFARDFNFGFLNACPSNLGTAMAASVHLELPGFAKSGFPELQKRCAELKLKASKGRGKSDITFDISNKFCMSFDDIELIQMMIDGINTLYNEDVELQKKHKIHTPMPVIKSKNSLVAKYVTADLYKALSEKKTLTCGFTLRQAISNSVLFENQKCGIYAGDKDSYKDFKDVFDPILRAFHGIGEDARHKSDMDVKSLKGNIRPGVPVHSVRIRVGRNIDGFGFSAGITQGQRQDVEVLMKRAFEKMTGEFFGRYFPLKGLLEDDRKKMAENHCLFQSGNSDMIVGGMEREWPEARGIFHTKDYDFHTWVNEEDHLRIITIHKGSNVRGAFEHLMRGVKAIQDAIKSVVDDAVYCIDPKLGYLTSCPTNVGSALRASVHVDLPGWTKAGLPMLRERCAELNIQARGTGGESRSHTGWTYDISSIHRLGVSEVQLVQTLINGVNTLSDEDLKLQKKYINVPLLTKGLAPPLPEIKSKDSLVAKYVTPDIWAKLGGHKTATSDFTLSKAIACAVEFENQHCGIYAGDWDSYIDFRDVFDPIIQEYHGISANAIHITDMDASKIKGNIMAEVPVHSVRIRVGRSIDGFGLSPGISKEQRLSVESIMKESLTKFTGELAGEYYPLTGMDENTRKQLVEDHFLFVSGDKNLKVAGMERDWPEGRGIFHNKDKTFLVWVNEEDQIRIISMEIGGDVQSVFKRLVKGVHEVSERVKENCEREFIIHPQYGYVHSCPTNLGTGMRASVHVELPGWTVEGLDALKTRCEELKVQPRGSKGESGGQTGTIYDISNKHRLGYSEVELVQTMIDSVNVLYAEDVELQKKHGIYPAMPVIKSEKSMVAKFVNLEVWKELCEEITATSAFTLRKAISCAVMYTNQTCGIYAGDYSSYKIFKSVFDPIIQEYHGIGPNSTHTSDMDSSKITGNINPEAPVHSVRVRVGRNIEGFGLSPGITQTQRLKVEEILSSVLPKLSGDLAGTYYPLKGMTEEVRNQLIDDHFLFQNGDPNLKVAFMERDWPEGRGIFHNEEKTFLVWVNEEDQLRIIAMEMGSDVKGTFERLARGIITIKDNIKESFNKDFYFDEKYGYIHSCPTNLGTGMRASVHVDLPGWTKEGVDALNQRCAELKVQHQGTKGEGGGQTGFCYDISNKHRLGYTEVELIQNVIDAVNTLFEEDIELQMQHKIYPAMPEIKSKNSLVAKHVTPVVWKNTAEHKTGTCGYTLRKAIACALTFPDQHCGIYAGDWDSYNDFKMVFDPIIQEYHGISIDDVHTSDMDITKIKANINPDAPINSVRIRVGRSINGYGLSPGITRNQRLEVESTMKKIFKSLSGELSGNYYPLAGMSEKVRQNLVEDHFLFMSGDRNLKVAGMERDWPEGRGIFHNEQKTFLVWVNEEDQMRIISMDIGGDVKGCFERLVRGITAVEESLKNDGEKEFMLDPKYGYIHSCPTNLGTGMRASAHIELPGWTKEGPDRLHKRCGELALQARGTRGESGGQTGSIYDISNKHRLGRSEVELVQGMIDSINTLYKEDIELQKKHGLFPVVPEILSSHSLVAKYVTKEVYKELAGIKTATSGFTLRQAIACACMFDNQHCGIYAGDWDSYKDFSKVFDPLIQEYHGIKPDAVHTSNLDVEKVNGNINPASPVHSVRIRVGRNIDGFGLSPGITKKQRVGVEDVAKKTFAKLTEDLAGTYYPLEGMEDTDRQKLVDDHFLFMSGDRNLKVAGMERDWPEGRGIFHNAEKTFLIWVNEEDQLRIISMQKGGDVRAVFGRLVRGIKAVEESVKAECGKDMQLDPKYGYIHSCPTNLGTGMRASVHIDLPGWTKSGMPALKKRCEELKVQPRGTKGESGGQTGWTFDISNKHRLGYSEVELVQCMIDAVNTLFEEDVHLQEKLKMVALHSGDPAPPFPEIKSKNSLVAKYVTPEIWKKLGGHSTATSGFTLSKAIACAVQFDNQHCGIYAGDWDSYIDFKEIFDPLIQEYHNVKTIMGHKSDMDASKIKGNINEDVPVNSVRIRVGRSINGFGLSPGITKEQRLAVEDLMKKAFQNMTGDLVGSYHPLTGMEESVRQQLVDDHFLFMSGDANLKVAGMERDWPEGRGIYHNQEKTFLIWVNEEDQMRIISMDMGRDVCGVFERLTRGVKSIGDSIKAVSGRDFCVDPKLGFIHSCPTNLGTGMRASVHLDLPGWHKDGLDNLKKRCEALKLQPRGTKGESGGETGCTYDISNKHRLGYTEVQLVQCMIDGVNSLYKEDIELQIKHKIYPVMPLIKSKDSLVAKHVTPKIWQKLGAIKTKTCNYTLRQAIACAVQFENQHCGIYAGDWDCYKEFAPVFDPIIQEYHGISPDSKHTSDMDPTKVKGEINGDAPVHSVRIRVGRSIDGFGLSPGITKTQRVEVEGLMKKVFMKLDGELAGTYYSLGSLTEKDRKQLVEDHFLFMSGDPNLRMAGMERDWPEGRGIFHNKEKTFLVWVNEEDQTRIISMESGGDVSIVFDRLVRGVHAVETIVKAESGKDFMVDEKYGFIHSCPTNLGTGMRASVHIDLPGWNKEGMDALKKKCEELKVQPRGTRGESGGQTGCTFDISNKHRLGYTEVQLVQCMIDSVNALFNEDIELQKKHGIYPVLPEFRSTESLAAKHTNAELWSKLSEHKTALTGFCLRKAVSCAIHLPNQKCGIYAGDWDSYKDFNEIFDPIIQEYHGIEADAAHTSDMDVSKIKGNINPDAPVHSIRIRIGRNIQGFGLPPGMNQLQRFSLEELMKQVLESLKGDLHGEYFPLLGMTDKTRKQLEEDNFLFTHGDFNLKEAGMERDWPEGRGVFHNETKNLLVWINEEDQLKIIAMEMGGDVQNVFERLTRGITAIKNTLNEEFGRDFMLDPKYGYIHSCPSNLGTGMRASVHMDLPGWNKEGYEALQKRCDELKIQAQGAKGESGVITGCTFSLSNKHCLGYSEVQIMQTMIDGINTIFTEDIEMQKKHDIFPAMPLMKSKNSLVAKYCTPIMYKRFGAHKTATSGFTLQKAIACATTFDNQHCGIYAGDWDSYKDYKDIFDGIIYEYHGIKPFTFQMTSLEITKLQGNVNPDAPVLSVRIRVGRNIEGYGLSPGITRAHRKEVETLMMNVFKKLPSDLAGNYYQLNNMSAKVKQDLIDNHFLFMSGDPNLKVAGMERDWPEARGIFYNPSKTFLIWLNEEDQMRIIAMERGGDVCAVFQRLARGITSIGKTIKADTGKEFAKDFYYGYIHSCPTNLGTGLRASVHIDLPGFNKEGLDILKNRCSELKLQPRGTGGESKEFAGFTYDISNKHRMGYTEVELVQTVIDGVNTLYEEDLELQKKHGIYGDMPEILSKNSLVAKYVTPELYKELSDIKTKTTGFTIRKAIACSFMFNNQSCGIYAGDLDCYREFAEVFDPIIQDYHGINDGATHKTNLDPTKVTSNIKPLYPAHSVRIRVGRNIDGFGLSPGISQDQRLEVEEILKKSFQKLTGDLAGSYIPLKGMDEKTRQKLVEDHFLFMSGDSNLAVAGMERDWPDGRGIFHNTEKSFLVWVNQEDQIRIISMQKGGDVPAVFERLCRGIKAVEAAVKAECGKGMAVDSRYGFIHSCPTNLGTGMRASVLVDLPGWTKAGQVMFLKRCEELKVQPRGAQGESGGSTGWMYDISNKHRLGYTEAELVQTLIDAVNTLFEEDMIMQKKHLLVPLLSGGHPPPFPDIKSKNSLVAKYVTPELWAKLGGHETATTGYTLGKAIACAVQFEDQHCGIYAGDWDSYVDFQAIFDPIVQEYHGIPANAIHQSDMDINKIKGNIEEGAPVHSVRIRVGRSIDGFGLSPGIPKNQRLAIEQLMIKAFQKLTGDLAGTYHPLTGMNERVQKQLVKDHFLFMSGDKNLIAAGMERDWPEGRGIFHNKEKTFLTWVNEEDQLRIISMDVGGNVYGVFERLVRGINAVGESVKAECGKEFAFHPKYGFVHSCPTNLGTGMRASVHIELPGWCKEGIDMLKRRCTQLKLQPRSTTGESGGQTGVTFDISNKHRLGYTEVQLVQTMIDGVNIIFKEDIELQKKHDIYPAMPDIESKNSLVAKHLTPDLWKKLGTHATETTGFTLRQAVACAILYDNQHIGIYAGDYASYDDYKELFTPIIEEYHSMKPDDAHVSDTDVTKITSTVNDTAPVYSVRIRVGRNINGYGLSPGITSEQRLKVELTMKSCLGKLLGDLEGTYHPLGEMTEEVRQQMVDDHFLFMSGDRNLKVAGMERDWPEGRGIYLNKDKTFLVWVNEEDQLRIISMEKGNDVKSVFNRLFTGVEQIRINIKVDSFRDFSIDHKYGYVHSCPSNLGTGMRASIHIDLPGWNKKGLESLHKRCDELKLQARGTRGESGGETGYTFDISNKHRLGYTEVQLVQTMIDGVNKLYDEDIEFQQAFEIYPVMPEIKSKDSLVAKHVNIELYKKLGVLTTATTGFTLQKAIACSVLFENQSCGIYAGDWDSYKDFAELFEPIIQEYHGFSAKDNHTSDMNMNRLKGNINPEVPVHSVRIRVGRNIDGFGLSPGITRDQRMEVEDIMKQTLVKLSGDLAGTYYPLQGMEEGVRRQLVEDHFLFMSGDPNLQVAGMERDFPEGRGIFHNREKTFLVWVNEEDQMRIISMDHGGDVRGVFERLIRGITEVGENIKGVSGKEFMLDPKYGFIHACPTNLGTGMRASVHVDLPGWTTEGFEALKARCDTLGLQPRGTRGESGGLTGITYDISNKRRLGFTEIELVQYMIDGVNTLYKEDVVHQKKHEIFPVMPVIQSQDSLAAKFVTQELWKKHSEHRTALSQFSLRQAIACAVLFDNQHCGIYAGDLDSYKDFADIFDPLIQSYHDLKPDAIHTTDMDVSKINGNINPKVPVHSVRIRVGRSIEGYGLSPGIERKQRLEVEKIAKNALEKLPGDLAGTYYPLKGMEEQVRQQLVDDHFLFMSGDRNLKVAGMERDWPEGRGIFHNAAKTFLVWVNEEDQFRIISMQTGGDVICVFERLVQGIKAVGEAIKKESDKEFMYDPKYGFIHSCPTNLGTGMRASVHVDLPGWTKAGMDKLKKRCNELNVQPRGTRGESGGMTGWTYDISNKHRLGYSEVQLIQTMIDAVNKLSEEDLTLQKRYRTTPLFVAGAIPPFPVMKSKESLAAKYVTPALWEKLAGHKTCTSDFTLSKSIACAVEFDNQHCGIYAGDWDTYIDFQEIFDPLIHEYHGIKANQLHTSDMDIKKLKNNIDENAPVHSVRIRVGRSMDGYGLSPGITQEQRLAVEDIMKIALAKLSGDLKGEYYPLTGMSDAVHQKLVDDHFLFMSGDPNLKAAGMERDWPEGRGIFHNQTKTFLVWVNEEDQMRIISMDNGGDVRSVFERLVLGINEVHKSIKESGKDFAVDAKYGYIHSCPTNLGTGMRASVHIDLPGFTKEGVEILKKRCSELKVQPRGTRGESGGQTGYTYDISNKHRLGYTEVELVQTMIDSVNTLYNEDIVLQKKHKIYPVMPEIKSKDSLVAKHLTPDIWKTLCEHKTATTSFMLRQAVACTVMFNNQHCGIYAGDWDSYKDYAVVFDPIIQEYHGIKPEDKHISDMDVGKIKGIINTDAPVHSVRIRVGRSIDGFGLSPGITRKQRVEVENIAKNCFMKLKGDLQGKYYPLQGMEEKDRQQLVNDHFLFMSGDQNLKVAGMERNWPEGRGIFHNVSKTFLVWVNEEDQLRIISMEHGGDVVGTFARLVRGLDDLQLLVKEECGKEYSFDPKYGYIHSCPTNLGTGMRASVHIDLPGWAKEGTKSMKKKCEILKLQPRGTRGESGGDTGVTFDISNKHRLGYTEVELVQCMIDGVNTLYEEDIELQKKHNIFPAMPEINSKSSLVAKYLTADLWKKLAEHRTATCGFTLRKATACAITFDNQHCGIYAGDQDSYKDFAQVFDPIISDYHGLAPDFVHTSDMDVSKINGNINTDVPVHSVRIRVGRSVEGFALPPGIDQLSRLSLEFLLQTVLTKLPGDLAGQYYPLTGMSEETRLQLVDDHFLFVSGDRNLKLAGMEREWPEGRGIFHNDSKSFLVWVNEEDQLRIISMNAGGDVCNVFERLVRGIKSIEENLKSEVGRGYIVDPKYGYIHSCPTNLGTGMRASVHVDLPGFTLEGIETLKKRCEELYVQPRGTRGESGEQTGVTYDISNKHRLGYSEVQLVQCMIDSVNTLYKEDIEFQKKHGIYPVMPVLKSTDSLVAKHFTHKLWKKFSEMKTKTTGYSLLQAISCATTLKNQHCGIYAGDYDCYKEAFFKDVFDPIILEYHGIKPFTYYFHQSSWEPTKINGAIIPEAPVHSVRIRIGRNIDTYGLSPGITREQRLAVEKLAKNAFSKYTGDLVGEYIPLTDMKEEVRQKLVDDHFLFISGDPNLKVAGMERDWPEARGIYHNNDKTFLVWVNEEDQLRLISMDKGSDIKACFIRLGRAVKDFEKSLKTEGKEFIKDFYYGYIHSCPSNLGTGMRASVHIDLPGLHAEGLEALKALCEEHKLQARGTQGESGGQTGSTYDISNKHRMGYTEGQLVQTMIDGVNALYEKDLELQKKHGL